MLRIGAEVRIVRHDQYPALVGETGTVTNRGGRADAVSVAQRAGSGQADAEQVYRVSCGKRTLHDLPESWLEMAGAGRGLHLWHWRRDLMNKLRARGRRP